ncbi:putative flavoprotein involved in K+ transport [Promicromonospora umidemergens]|uniref:ArsO family NAD(P)H-dependent flavin-containing monooxygenase n=1 Tax=Promicromonospora umidemergens TaxID=629679 RepID=A0ABP8WE17_9MICO|nr:NAD(P)-binding domain-containing protein [Promicromonospora umidemergens]MCP2285998.1 putative flavoprotein involved in K+ transport [Promicromonospora umidemergens]
MTDAIVIGGGQAGLAAAHALLAQGLRPTLLEAGDEPVGSWPRYYDSLHLFSPARYSTLPGLAFPGDPDRYPRRDEVVDYLRTFAKSLDADIRTGHRVTAITHDGDRFTTQVPDEQPLSAPIVIAATGAFSSPHQPSLPGLDRFTGAVLHSSEYRDPAPFAGQRVVVVGAANSAVQIAVDLAPHARVTLATRAPVRYTNQTPLGRDAHFWLTVSGYDALPIGPWLGTQPSMPVLDTGTYRTAVDAGRPDQRRMFTAIDGDAVTWPDGSAEDVDTILLATGFRPDISYLGGLGALDANGAPRQRRGLSTTHPGLGYVGLEWQRSFSSASIRGAGRDAAYVVRRLARRRG